MICITYPYVCIRTCEQVSYDAVQSILNRAGHLIYLHTYIFTLAHTHKHTHTHTHTYLVRILPHTVRTCQCGWHRNCPAQYSWTCLSPCPSCASTMRGAACGICVPSGSLSYAWGQISSISSQHTRDTYTQHNPHIAPRKRFLSWF